MTASTPIPRGDGVPLVIALVERESDQARAQQHKARCGQCKEPVGDNVVVAHVTPTTLDARPNLLKLSESSICQR